MNKFFTIVLPGVAVLYAILTVVWDLPNPVLVLGTLAALTVLGGLLKGISSQDEYDGELSIVGDDPDTGIPHLELKITRDPNELVRKNAILFKTVDER